MHLRAIGGNNSQVQWGTRHFVHLPTGAPLVSHIRPVAVGAFDLHLLDGPCACNLLDSHPEPTAASVVLVLKLKVHVMC